MFHRAEEHGWERPWKMVTVEIKIPTGTKEKEIEWPVLNAYGRPGDHLKNVVHFVSEMKQGYRI